MQIDRRKLLTGAAVVVGASAVPLKALAVPLTETQIDADLINLIGRCVMRYQTEIEFFGDHLHIFEDEVLKQLDAWGTKQPLKPVHMVSFKDGVMTREKTSMKYDPNLWGQVNYCGMKTDGFGVSFTHPLTGDTIRVNYSVCERTWKFRTLKKEQDDEKPHSEGGADT